MSSLRVIHVEDDVADAELISETIADAGLDCAIERVDKRATYIAALERGPVDLILSDYALPSFSGEEAMTLARELAPDTPFVFVSGAIGEEAAIELLRRGATDYVLKDRSQRLGPVVRRALAELAERQERQRAQREAAAAHERAAYLADASKLLAGSLTVEQAIASLVRLTVPYLADYCVIELQQENGSLELADIGHRDPAQAEVLRSVRKRYPAAKDRDPAYRVLKTGQSEMVVDVQGQVVADVSADAAHLAMARQIGATSMLLAPLSTAVRHIGVVIFGRLAERPAFSGFDVATLEEIARRTGLAIENGRLHDVARKAIAARDELLSVVSHDLRNPLSTVRLAAKALQRADVAKEAVGLQAQRIERSVEQMTRLVEDLLDVGRSDRKQLRLNRETVAVSTLIEDCVELARPLANHKGIVLDAVVVDAAAIVSCDRARVGQVLSNLLGNAIKFTPAKGHVRVTASTRANDLVVDVSDTGPGIAAAQAADMFKRFWTTGSSSGGIGLGLYIAKSIVEAHGGTITARPGETGAVFTFTLPLQMSAAAEPSPRDDDAQAADVLIVEDDVDIRDALMSVLAENGISASSATNGLEALRWLRTARKPRVILLDLAMPVMNGFQFRDAQRIDPDLASIPAVVVTATGSPSELERLGVRDLLIKPINLERLLAIVRRYCPAEATVH